MAQQPIAQQPIAQQPIAQQPIAQHPPKGGWNPAFSQQDKTDYTNYYLYIKPLHGEIIAEIISQMIIYKRKYHLKYSEEQEAKIAAVFLTRSVKASVPEL